MHTATSADYDTWSDDELREEARRLAACDCPQCQEEIESIMEVYRK